MSTENTNTTSNETPSSPSTSEQMSALTAETPSSSTENLSQSSTNTQSGDFASWLSDRLDSFEKGQETAPWEKTEEPQSTEEDATEEKTDTTEEASAEPESEKDSKTEVEEDTDTKNMSGSAGAKFKELKNELKAYKAKVAEMEKVLSERNSKTGVDQDNPYIQELKARVEEYEREISVARIEASPQFKQAVLEPTQAILDAAVTIAQKYEIAPRKLMDALRQESLEESSDALTELASDFSERDRVRLYRMVDDLAEVSRRRDILKENASRALSEMQQQQEMEEMQAEKRYREEIAKVATSTWDETFSNNPIIKSLGEDVMKEVQSASSEADLVDSAPEERAYAVYAGVALPHLVKKYAEVSAKLAETEKALSKYKKATPRVSGNTDTSPQKQEVGGFLDAIEKRFSLG